MTEIKCIYDTPDKFEAYVNVDPVFGIEIDLGKKYRHATAGAPIILENRYGVPVICVWANPESEDPSHVIELDKLRSES